MLEHFEMAEIFQKYKLIPAMSLLLWIMSRNLDKTILYRVRTFVGKITYPRCALSETYTTDILILIKTENKMNDDILNDCSLQYNLIS